MDAHTQERFDDPKALFSSFYEILKKLEKDGRILTKSKLLSIEAREAGNNLYIMKGHDSHVHKDILNYYSKSIVLAPDDTEELALGYSNRSILLMHFHLYKESLIDIDRALNISKDDVFKTKLQARKDKCFKLISNENSLDSATNISFSKEDKDNLATKLMNFQSSTILPCASDCVGLAYNNKFGRYLVATRDINPGEILIVEECYVCSPQKSLMYIVCSHCLQIAWNGIPCDHCVFTIYCSEACKNQALEEYHNIECSMLKYMDYTADKMCDRMATVRLLIKAVKKESFQCIYNEAQKKYEEKDSFNSLLSDGILCNDQFKSYYNLLSHATDVNNKNEDDDLCESILVYLLAEHTNFFTIEQNSTSHVSIESNVLSSIKDILIKLKHIFDTNAFWYQAPLDCDCQTVDQCTETCNSSRGVFLSSTSSLLNHSCTPNVSRIYVPKRKVIVFANSPIKEGDQLCDSYGVTYTADVKYRQEILEHGFNFTCTCMACADNFKMTGVSDSTKQDWNKILTEYKQHYSEAIASSFFVDHLIKKLELSEEYFQCVKTISELLYKHLNFYAAFGYNAKCRTYIEILLLELYGEQCIIPNDC